MSNRIHSIPLFTALPLLLLLLLLDNGAKLPLAWAADEPAAKWYEPPFPTLFYDSAHKVPIWPQRAKIVSEVIGGDFRRTNAEYLDLDAGKAALVLQNGQYGAGSEVLLSDIALEKFFRYKPYTCESLAPDDPTLHDLDHWSSIVTIDQGQEASARNLRLFGVGAMWLFAAQSSKSYSYGNMVYSAGKDLFRMAHNWTLVDDSLDLLIRFDFISSTFSKEAIENKSVMLRRANKGLSLEMVEILDKSGKSLRTINILSIEYDLSMSDYANILTVPVGYGCNNKFNSEHDQQIAQEILGAHRDFWSKYLFRSSKVDLEVTATKIERATNERSSETLYAEVAHLTIEGSADAKDYDLVMSKVKSKHAETKTVENHLFNVRYQIDLQRGSCTMSHIAQSGSGGQRERALELSFSNGLALALGRDQFSVLFASRDDDFQLSVAGQPLVDSKGNMRRNIFMERTIRGWPIGVHSEPMRSARLIRTYLEETSLEGDSPSVKSRLASVTIWLFEDESQARIAEIYQFNLVDQEGPLWAWDVPRLFDVSQECYLDNEHMRAGHDYAWVEFFYPLASRQLDVLAENEAEAKAAFYERLVHEYALTGARVPRFELMFSDEGLVVRALLLDLPDIALLYEAHENQAIVLRANRGDLKLVAPDLRHCTEQCQLYDCKSMSYCVGVRSCLLGMSIVSPTNTTSTPADQVQGMVPDRSCMTYSEMEPLVEGTIESARRGGRLNTVLSMIAHQDYDNFDMPQLPDEVGEPRGDNFAATADNEYREAIGAYMAELHRYLSEKRKKLLWLVATLEGQFMVLLPTRFLIEDDPLDNFGLGQEGQDIAEGGDIFYDPNKVASFFHEGLPMARFKFSAFQAGLADKSSLLAGLSYDQCALACIDSRCGTFSHCSDRKECILTNLDTISEASSNNLVESDTDCFIAQRDFAKNFLKYANTARPNEYQTASRKASVSDCALGCLRADTACMSFEFCQPQGERAENCFTQLARQPAELFSAPQEGTADSRGQRNASAPPEQANTGCDHYERSYLAEFNLIEARTVSADMLNQLKTTEFLDAITPMDCANTCLNQLNDCSAFQFCFDPSPASSKASQDGREFKYSHSCITIQSKPGEAEQQRQFEALVDSKSGLLAEPNKYLEYNRFCHVYALRPDTIQAHMRDLAMGNTMSVNEKRRLERWHSNSGIRMSWARYSFMFLSVALLSALLAVGMCYAREKSDYVRLQLDRVAHLVGRMRSRVHV